MDNKNTIQKRKTQGTGPSKTAVLTMLVLAVAAIFAIAVFSVAGKTGQVSGSTAAPTAAPVRDNTAEQKADKKIMAILEGVDTAAGTLQVYSIEDFETLTLAYASSTDIRDKYGLAVVAGQLSTGDILQITYDSEKLKATAVSISPDAWEYVRQSGIGVMQNRDIIVVGGKNYSFSEALHIYDGITPIELEALSKGDSFTMRGIGTEVYVILLTRGHGYISLREDQDYIGGSLFLNLDYITQVTEGMLLEVTEGTYDVTLENGDLTAKLTAVIRRGETTVLNLAEYARVPDPAGQVTFRIQPEGAVLWIDDVKTYYNLPVELNYGTYQIRVESGGYVSYEGSLKVASASMTADISLVENITEGSEEEDPAGSGGEDTNNVTDTEDNDGIEDENGQDGSAGGSTGSSQDNTSENTSGDAFETDDDHSIIIYSDEEVEIYLDGDYMGVIEDGQAVFEKYIGSFTLELVKGDETKSYIIQVDDDGEDFEFRRYFE